MNVSLLVLLLALALWILYLGRAFWAWVLPSALGLSIWYLSVDGVTPGLGVCGFLYVLALGVLAVPGLRQRLVTKRIMPMLAPLFPSMSRTEREALEAGTVWWDAELFGGRPEWKKLLELPVPELDLEERAFLSGPCHELCRLLGEERRDGEPGLSPELWTFLGEKGFFGMIIPREYGGLGFSARANGAVVARIASRSMAAAVTVMVPNSLGPAELLLHHGTEAQRRHYLPRLARGEEIPCFALTEPGAGSDAGAMTSRGVVCRGEYGGEEVLGVRLTWNKRYITLSAVATVIGLAFRLLDPEHLLGDEEELGITCALIPADTAGVVVGERHDPLGVPFVNGPTRGEDVFVPLACIIGGPAGAGKGWGMLMSCLAAGRGISLPALAGGAAELTARAVGAYATVREQFNTPIGRFGGIEECLASIGGWTYLIGAARHVTAAAIDAGEKPAVISAICKAYLTEGMRRVVNLGMDVMAGAGIVRGPRNVLADTYAFLPIPITVEGANILTRSMIVFGQGALRCHPFAREELEAIRAGDVRRFDRAFFGHLGRSGSNFTRAAILGWTASRVAHSPIEGPLSRAFQHFERMSAAFATCAEAAMMTLGGELKRKEKLTGRLADALSWLYLGTASLKRYVDEGQTERDEPFVRWATEHALHQVEQALLDLLDNLPARRTAWFLRWKLFPPFARHAPPSDLRGSEVAKALLDGAPARLHLTSSIHVPGGDEPGLGRLETALQSVVAAAPARVKIRAAMRAGQLPRGSEEALLETALQAGVIDAEERDLLRAASEARWEAIQVDAR